MNIGILKEPEFESRVSMLPEIVEKLFKQKVNIFIENGAGELAFAGNDDYEKAGAKILSRSELIAQCEVLICIHFPEDEIKNKILIGTFFGLIFQDKLKKFTENQNTLFSLDNLPRTTRAQAMDVLSSQANIAGYKAVVLAATEYSRYFPMFMTAAGSIAPAKILIIGAGVAGLQAIATAKRLGAVVEVFDTRPAVKEEVQSLGAKFVEIEGAADATKAGGYAVEQSEEYKQKQKDELAKSVTKSDIIITTAQIPGKKAPLLIDDTMLSNMRKGSVIIDLAAQTGGNTTQTKNAETNIYDGIKIIGNSNLQASMSSDASKVYGKNIFNFLQLVIDGEGQFNQNMDDDLVAGSCISQGGQIINERIKNLLN